MWVEVWVGVSLHRIIRAVTIVIILSVTSRGRTFRLTTGDSVFVQPINVKLTCTPKKYFIMDSKDTLTQN